MHAMASPPLTHGTWQASWPHLVDLRPNKWAVKVLTAPRGTFLVIGDNCVKFCVGIYAGFLASPFSVQKCLLFLCLRLFCSYFYAHSTAN